MASRRAKRGSRGKSKKRRGKSATPWEVVVQAGASVIAGIIDRFGWPGGIFILSYIFVERHASAIQKQALIDKFLLSPELPGGTPWAVTTVLFAAIILFQRMVYRQRDALKDAEIRRLAEWKSERQQAELDAGAQKLHSTKRLGG